MSSHCRSCNQMIPEDTMSAKRMRFNEICSTIDPGEEKKKFRDGKNRLLTYQDMEWDEPVNPVDLAEAGFIARSSKDVQCVFCHLGLSLWHEDDVPILEHRKFSPRCPFMAGYDVKNVPIISDPIRGNRHPLLPQDDVADGCHDCEDDDTLEEISEAFQKL